ncbi:MAG: restriction endonuclease subunit S [Bacteroidetes bacterium]|nr:restriction endonuclease subunit S [Bacteroidota bacterium]
MKKKIPDDWKPLKYEDVLDYIQPTKYIVSSTEYSNSYKTPVLTAGKSFIIGYTNEKDGIFDKLPVIIFDDFTTATKFVNFPFKVKSSAMKILVPKSSEVNIKFIYYLMQTIHVTNDTHKRYWISVYAKLKLYLPSIDAQNSIVAKIEELLSELDNGIAQLKTAQQQLKTYRQAVLKYAFEGRLTNDNVKDGELPKGWKWVKIADVAEVGTGATPLKGNTEYYGGNIPWVTSGALNDDFVKEATDYVTTKALKETNLTVYPKHTLLVAMYGEGKTRGKCSELLIDACTNQAIAAINFDKHDNKVKPYLKYFLLKNYNDIRKLSSGGVQPNLNLGIIKKTFFPFPTIKEQEQIVNEIERRLSVADKLEETITTSLQQSESLRQSILKKAFEGKLVRE